MLNGSSNGGKSLSSTYDQAHSAYSLAQSAANTVANGYGGNGKSLSATYDKANAASGDATYIRMLQ